MGQPVRATPVGGGVHRGPALGPAANRTVAPSVPGSWDLGRPRPVNALGLGPRRCPSIARTLSRTDIGGR